jgi:hypothetical protein
MSDIDLLWQILAEEGIESENLMRRFAVEKVKKVSPYFGQGTPAPMGMNQVMQPPPPEMGQPMMGGEEQGLPPSGI